MILSGRLYRRRLQVVATATALFAAACAPATSDAHASAASPIAQIHQRQCSRCHAPPDPGSHTRAQLEDAFSRHHARVHLSTDEWAAMVDYLAAPPASATSAPTTRP
jgi:hypothetical protein